MPIPMTAPDVDQDFQPMSEEDQLLALAPSLAPQYTNVRQAAIINRLTRLLFRGLDSSKSIRVRTPVDFGKIIVPDPAVVVCRSRPDDYASCHPQVMDINLIVEVIINVEDDNGSRFDLYAEQGVTTVWAIDIENEQIMIQDNRLGVNTLLHGSDIVTVPDSSMRLKARDIFV